MNHFNHIFGDYLSKTSAELVQDCELLLIEADAAAQTISADIKCPRIISPEDIWKCQAEIEKAANLKQVTLQTKYLPTLFSTEYFPMIVTELKTRSSIVNGFFENADVRYDGSELLVFLKNGGRELLMKARVDVLIKKIIADHFSFNTEVLLQEDVSLPEFEDVPPPVMEIDEPIAPPAPRPAPEKSPLSGKQPFRRREAGGVKEPTAVTVNFAHLNFKNDGAMLIKGRKITGDPLR